MKRDYERLHKRYDRHNHGRHKDLNQCDVKQMSAKLEVKPCHAHFIP